MSNAVNRRDLEEQSSATGIDQRPGKPRRARYPADEVIEILIRVARQRLAAYPRP